MTAPPNISRRSTQDDLSRRAAELADQALRCRHVIIDIAAGPVGCHLGGSLSVVEILLAAMEVTADEEGSTVVLSKGHAAAALYAANYVRGLASIDPALDYGRAGSNLTGHPGRSQPGVEFATGSLGHGVAYAAGWALAQRVRGTLGRAIAVVGDGELQEGLVWETLQIAGAKKLDNFTVVVDVNGGQNDGYVDSISPIADLEARFNSFGAVVDTVDGHDTTELLKTLAPSPGFRAVVARTVKAKGIPGAEGLSKTHYARISSKRAREWKSAIVGSTS